MRHVGIRDLKTQASSLLNSGETLVIERHDTPIGYFIPIQAKDRGKGRESLERLGETVGNIMAETGMSEDDLVNDILGPSGRL